MTSVQKRSPLAESTHRRGPERFSQCCALQLRCRSFSSPIWSSPNLMIFRRATFPRRTSTIIKRVIERRLDSPPRPAVPCQPRAGVASGVTVGLASRRPKSAPRAPSSRIHLAARGALVRSLGRRALSLSQHSSDSTSRARQADTPRGREDGGERLTDPALPLAIGDEFGCAGVRRRQSSGAVQESSPRRASQFCPRHPTSDAALTARVGRRVRRVQVGRRAEPPASL